jgi:hypothetical protein
MLYCFLLCWQYNVLLEIPEIPKVPVCNIFDRSLQWFVFRLEILVWHTPQVHALPAVKQMLACLSIWNYDAAA